MDVDVDAYVDVEVDVDVDADAYFSNHQFVERSVRFEWMETLSSVSVKASRAM